jgi:uncharacterized SAM-binding protein YcdF (DUF218 family)
MVNSLVMPIVWVLVLLSLGLFLSRWRQRAIRSGAGWYLVLAGTLTLLALSTKPIANLLTYSLECRYTPPASEVLGNLDIVVVLGGGAHSACGLRQEAEPSGPSYSRICNGVRAFQQSSASLLAICGGPPEDVEAEVMKTLAVSMGVHADRILTETQSANTMQNAACLARLLPEGKTERIGLVTSATHMLRAERTFKKQFPKDTIIPIPADYTYDPFVWAPNTFIPSAAALEESTVALHEWIGIVWYSLRYR